MLAKVPLKPFCLSNEDHKKIASILGLPRLPHSVVLCIEHGIALYKTLSSLPHQATIGENIAAIDEALKAADKFEKTLRRFTDTERSGAGAGTFHNLYPYAGICLVAVNEFRAVARVGKKELRQTGRLGSEHGPLGALGRWLRLVFDVTEEVKQANPENKVERLRAFGRAVFEVADIPCHDYYAHPSRMDPLFNGRVPDGRMRPPAELRQEIAQMLRTCGE
jgi:hypothetical protein